MATGKITVDIVNTLTPEIVDFVLALDEALKDTDATKDWKFIEQSDILIFAALRKRVHTLHADLIENAPADIENDCLAIALHAFMIRYGVKLRKQTARILRQRTTAGDPGGEDAENV